MLKRYKRWTKIEDEILKDNIRRNISQRDIAEILNRPYSAISDRVRMLHWAKPLKRWTEKETYFLRENYSKMKLKKIADKLGRTVSAVSGKAKLIGLSKAITEEQRRQAIQLAQNSILTNVQIAGKTGMSVGSINRIFKQAKIRRKTGCKLTNSLLNGFRYGGNGGVSKHRYQLLYVYRNTCWDCKKTFVNESDLQIHHDLTKIPVTVFVLCKECHGKRHGRDFKLGTRNN